MNPPTFCTLILHWRDHRRAESIQTDVPLLNADGEPHAERLFEDLLAAHRGDIQALQLYQQTGCPSPGKLLKAWPDRGEMVATVRELVAQGAALPVRNVAGRGNEA